MTARRTDAETSLDHRPPPPFNREAEEALVGAVLVDPEALELKVLAKVSASDFFVRRCGIVWRVARQMHEAGEHVDVVTLSERLDAEGVLDEIGGPAWLTEVIARTPTSLGAPAYAKIVLNDSQRRVALQVGSDIAKAALNDKIDAVTVWDQAAGMIERVRHNLPVGEPQCLTDSELAEMPFGSLLWVAGGLIPVGGVALWSGVEGRGKTWLALDLALAVAYGQPFLGRGTLSSRVVYVAADMPVQMLNQRLANLMRGREIEPSGRLLLTFETVTMADRSGGKRLLRLVEQHKAGLLVVDSLYSVVAGLEENDAGAMGYGMTGFRRIAQEANCAVLILHHPPKSNTADARGSGVLRAAPDEVRTLSPSGNENEVAGTLRVLKSRNLIDRSPIGFRLQSLEDGGVVIAGDVSPGDVSPSLAEGLATEMLTILADGEQRSRKSLLEQLRNRGMKASARTLDKAFVLLQVASGVVTVKPGPGLPAFYRIQGDLPPQPPPHS